MNERKDETPSIYTIASNTNLVPIRSRQAYLKRRRYVPNCVMICLCLLAALCFIAALTLSILYFTHKYAKLCETQNCVRIAASLKESMDTSVDPCDDFYKYACGKWTEEHPMPDTSITNSWFEERRERVYRKIRELLRDNSTSNNAPWAVNQAKILYNSCMDVHAADEMGLTPLFELLEELNLPPIPPAFTKKTSSYIEQMARVKRILGRDVFFGFDVIPDPRNTSKNIMLLDTPMIRNPLPNDRELEKRLHSIRSRFRQLEEEEDEDELHHEESDKYKEAEITYISGVIKQVLNNGSLDACSLIDDLQFPDEDDLQDVAETLYELTNAFYFLSRLESNQTIWEDDPTEADYMSVDELQKLTDAYAMETNSSVTPEPLWRPYIEMVFKDVDTVDLDGKDKILVADLEYLKLIAFMLTTTDEEELETYIWWTVIDIVVPHSSESLRKLWLKYIDEVTSVEIGESKSIRCAAAVNELMGMAVSWLYVDPSFHEAEGKKVFEMLDDIKEAFASMVSRTDWMDGKTKTATLEKNRKMDSQIGFPDWLFDEDVLNEYYEGIDLSETEYLDNMVQIVRLMSVSELECIHQVNYNNLSYWATDPTDVNAFHTYQFNHITIPAGILQFPFYELGLEALNYGAIGTVLGHELTHGFDNSGRHYDSNGNVRQWWTNETISEYTEKTQCFIEHYNSYYYEEVDDYIDGERTLGENIADNGGLREAVIAYERWKARHGQEPLLPGFTHLTHEQLVFLGFAHVWCEAYTQKALKWMLDDSHCPGRVRLQGVLKNSKEFSDAWKCPVGSNMNPQNKCRLW
ncbi:PREDICTED: neprilysin-2 [Dufourea novaeangliae]|uniref:Endothelin-converting enzyme 1 n=1 Tax=Dufourea novaeangliae TaxID=178035 RepID=A0A154P2K6_DUFNO|nr:PREDICTED: neprilysin-2 [Dufourea novaeangliae]KZC06063.1 Endothelin-converting enzyme 1 [Dufourea novaeangliae]